MSGRRQGRLETIEMFRRNDSIIDVGKAKRSAEAPNGGRREDLVTSWRASYETRGYYTTHRAQRTQKHHYPCTSENEVEAEKK